MVGASHHSASLATRDRLFIPDADLSAFDAELARAGVAHAIASTCDRGTGVARRTGRRGHGDPRRAGRRCGNEAPAAGEIYRLTGAVALRHVFAVAASLDSQVIGEPQVLGQVKAAHARARAAGRMAGALDQVLQAAFAGAKRVRSETAIGERPVSLASAAAQLIRDVHGPAERCAALLIGTGEMGEMMLEHLGRRPRRMTVAAPNPARAAEGATPGGCRAPAALDASLAAADPVVTARHRQVRSPP